MHLICRLLFFFKEKKKAVPSKISSRLFFFIKYRQYGGAAHSLLGTQLARMQKTWYRWQKSISILQNQERGYLSWTKECVYSGL